MTKAYLYRVIYKNIKNVFPIFLEYPSILGISLTILRVSANGEQYSKCPDVPTLIYGRI